MMTGQGAGNLVDGVRIKDKHMEGSAYQLVNNR